MGSQKLQPRGAHMHDVDLDILLLRHAQSAPDPALPEADWPLTPAGHASARALLPTLRALAPAALYTSPFLRARDTLAPFAAACGLTPRVLGELRERDKGGYVHGHRAFIAFTRRSFAHPARRPPGGESNHDAARRLLTLLDRLTLAHPRGARLLLSTHGNLIAATLAAIDPRVGFDAWLALGQPDLRRLVRAGGRWRSAALPTP